MDAVDDSRLVAEMGETKAPAIVLDIKEEKMPEASEPAPAPKEVPHHEPEKAQPAPSNERQKAKIETFTVKIERTTEEPVGLDIDVIDDISAVVVDIRAGAVENFNMQNHDRKIKPYDRIVDVNGERGDAVQLINKLKKETTWELTLQRPVETTASVTLPSNVSLGLSLKYAPSGTSLMIVSVDEGPMQLWNQQHVGNEVKQHDRIIEVNGKRGQSEQLVRAAHQQPTQKDQALELVILQYDDKWDLVR